ncbi:MAG: NADPH-dependent 7-cyano-7-deazaguanine reductase QueF [Dokdonella sp.]
MNHVHDSPLGKASIHTEHYDPSLLFPIARDERRRVIGIDGALPFHGVDIWNACELSWLNSRGKPQVAIGEFRVLATSPNIIESKSLKLYLNSYNQTRIDNIEVFRDRVVDDLSNAAGAPVAVALTGSEGFANVASGELDGESIDDLPISIDVYGPPAADQLRVQPNAETVSETLVSNLLKSNCPVTGQPDWASIQIAYTGAAIDRESLLRYLVSFRRHDDFHEHCVERIYMDINKRCTPTKLSVYARYTRRGGLDINPWRSSVDAEPPSNLRGSRQ